MAQELMAQEPMGQEPMAQEPMGQEPMAQEPMGQEPMAQEPMAREPAGSPSLIAEQALLQKARDTAAQGCTSAGDVLVRILCAGEIKVGLRTDYPRFSTRDPTGAFRGFEVDLARAIAKFLDVRLVPVAVEPKNRIPMLASGSADLVIATMGHTLLRDAQAVFIQPHYYRSRTVIVGAHDTPVSNWDDLRAGHTACVPLGASFNILLAQRHIRLMTFETPLQLADALNFNRCAIIVHDDTYFMSRLADANWSSRFGIKFDFATLPWGMAVARSGTQAFAELLTLLSIGFHADGVFRDLAAANGLDLSFLDQQRARWSTSTCIGPNGLPSPDCIVPPTDTSTDDRPTSFADTLSGIEIDVRTWLGIGIDLSILKSTATFGLMIEGILYSLALICGSMVSTLCFSFGFAWAGRSPIAPLRWLVFGLSTVGQSTPMPLLMFFGYIVAGGLTHYSPVVALLTAIVVLGFYNGSYTGRALIDARQALLADPTRLGADAAHDGTAIRQGTIVVAWSQLVSFLVNATKGSPAADMIGVPEFLAVLTDLTAHLPDRVGVYLVLLVFYSALVLLVIQTLAIIEKRVIRVMANPP